MPLGLFSRSNVRSAGLDAWAPQALAAFFASGGVLVATSCLLPGRTDPRYALVASAIALVTAVALLTARARLSTRQLHAPLVLGTALIASVVYSSGSPTSPDSLLFVWVVLFGGFFYSRPAALAHVAAIFAFYGLVLLLLPTTQPPAGPTVWQHLYLVTGAVTIAALWIAALRRLFDGLMAGQTRLARTDVLTGLANRAELVARGEARLRVPGAHRGVAIVLIDLDDFKLVNDSLGHPAGDALLREASRRLLDTAPAGALTARLGGDEFALLLEGAPGEDATAAHVARVIDVLQQPYLLAGEAVRVRASAGIAHADERATFEDLLRDADLAMYAAKDGGGGGAAHFVPALRERASRRRELDRDLRDALEREELLVAHQPIVRVDDAVPVATEALVRWRHPTRGLIPPAEFVVAAEKNGLIVPLGRWVLRAALRDASAWPRGAAGPLEVCVNLSPPQLLAAGLVADVRAALAEHGFPAERLVLEVTETAVMIDPDRSAEQLHALRDLGCRIAIDDFGTGHSSLEYLRRLPASIVKLAQPFVADLDRGGDRALARGIVELAHALDLLVVAEGVERAGQHAVVSELGCDLAQGYLFGRPVAGDEAAPLLRLVPTAPAAIVAHQRTAS